MAKAKRRSSRKGFTIPLGVLGGLAPTAIDVGLAVKNYGWPAGVDHLSMCTVGITTSQSGETTWMPTYALKRLWGPLLLGVLVHKMANRLGVNRAIANAGIPLVRI